jgi:chorismate mutase
VKSDEEISTADSAQIESLIERVKQGKLEQNDAQLIERLLRAFPALITLLQRKNTTIKCHTSPVIGEVGKSASR